MACSIFIFPQICLNVSDVKLMAVSKIIFFGSPYSANTILAAVTRSSAARLLTFCYNSNSHLMPNWLIMLHALFQFIFFVWTALYYV